VLLSSATTQAIAACYDAAVEPDLWPTALQRLGESLGAQSCTLGTWDPPEDPFRMPRSEAHEAFAALWLSHEAHAPDPHFDRGRRLSRSRAVLLEQDISSEWERRNLPYYAEIADPGDSSWWAAANFTVGKLRWSLPLYRGAQRGPFSPDEARYAALAAPQLSRLMHLAEKLADANLAVGLNTLERFRCAAMVINASGMVTRTNRAADLLLGSGIDVSAGRLATDRSLVDLSDLLLAVKRSVGPSGTAQRVLRREGLAMLLIEVHPVSAFASDYFSAGIAVVTLREVAISLSANAAALSEAFGLTPAEIRLAREIAGGQGLRAASASLDIGPETARSQLRAIFAKTGTSRQAELVALLSSFRR
jgi:DNA-binding CsgD family transcriptional regulator